MKTRLCKELISGLTLAVLLSGCAIQKPTTTAAGASPANNLTASQPAEHADLSGTWEYVMTNDQQEPMSGLLTIRRGGNMAGYTGSITLNGMSTDNEMNISKAQLNGPNFIYEGEVITPEGNIPFAMKGTIQGRNLEGQSTVVYKSQPLLWKVKATRK